MKTFFSLVALAAMTMTVQAQDMVIPTNGSNPNLEVIQDARLDPLSMNLGNTNENTVVCIGEVDFSENYQAVGMAFGQGWGGNGSFALLWAGEDYESALPFAQIALAHTRSYSNYTKLAGNMGYNVANPANLPGGRLAQEGLSFYRPEGKKKVYLTFVNGAGNIQAVHFYKNAFTAADFHAPGDWEPVNSQLLKPNEKSNYSEVSTRLAYSNSELVVNPKGETRKDGDGGWGWTSDGVVVDYGTMNFGNGEYTQVCTYVNHYSNNKNDKIEFYIDEVAEGNLIASLFTGMELRDQLYPKAKALTRTVTGTHKVLVKWVGGSTNITDVDFVKGRLWLETPDPDYALLNNVVNETPCANAKWYTMRNDVPEGAIKITDHASKNQAQPDGGGNYGWTNGQSVIKFGGIDFENGRFDRVILGYSTGGEGWIDYKDFANISLYLDLEKDSKTYDWKNAHEALADVEPVAAVRHQATGGWGNIRNIGDDLASVVTGVHDVYLVYYQKYTNEGANIFDLILDSHYSTYNDLAALEETEVASNKPVVINTDLEVVHKQGNIVWAKDNAQSYNFTTKEEGAIDYLRLFKDDYKNGDQNNWIRLVFANESAAGSISSGDKLSMVKGEYTGTPGEKHVLAVSGYESASERGNYDVNVYFPANFMGGTGNYEASGQTYFFVAPKIEEYCRLTMAVWNGEFFTLPAQAEGMNSAGIKGAVRADFSMCGDNVKSRLEKNKAYSFMGLVTKTPAASNGPAKILAQDGMTPTDYVFTITEDVTASDNIIVTGVDEVNVSGMTNKAVKMIENGQVVIIKNGKKYNMMGQTIK